MSFDQNHEDFLQHARHLRGLQQLLDRPLLAGFVVYSGREIRRLDEATYAISAAALFAQSPVGSS